MKPFLSILGYKSEAFYRVEDFKSEIAIVPISARSGVGVPELLSVLVGLTQQYLQKRLDQAEKEPRGIVLVELSRIPWQLLFLLMGRFSVFIILL